MFVWGENMQQLSTGSVMCGATSSSRTGPKCVLRY